MTLLFQLIIVCVTSLFVSTSSFAHHGFGVHYDISKQIEIEGVLQKVQLRNPHSFLEVLVKGEDGQSQVWVCETQAKSVIVRKGISLDRFKEGQRVTVQGSASRRSDNHCEVGNIGFADGTNLVFRSSKGRANIGEFDAVASDVTGSEAVLGTWVRAKFKGFPIETNVEQALTEAGVQANLSYSAATDDPSNLCIAANPVRAWVAPGTPTKISRAADQVIIEHEFMDAKRILTLHDQPHQQLATSPNAEYKPNSLGYSYAKFEDNHLIVHSAGFPAGVLVTQYGKSGVLHSEKMRLVETYSVNENSGELDYSWQAYDDDYFPTGLKGSFSMQKVNMEITPFDCKLENEK